MKKLLWLLPLFLVACSPARMQDAPKWGGIVNPYHLGILLAMVIATIMIYKLPYDWKGTLMLSVAVGLVIAFYGAMAWVVLVIMAETLFWGFVAGLLFCSMIYWFLSSLKGQSHEKQEK